MRKREEIGESLIQSQFGQDRMETESAMNIVINGFQRLKLPLTSELLPS